MRRRRCRGSLCKGRACQGSASFASDGWRRQQRAVRDGSCAAYPFPLSRGTVGACRSPPPLPRSGSLLAPGTSPRRPASIPPVRAQPGLVHPAPLAAGGGLIPALGPILQMEKLTHGARKCLALGPRGRVRTQVCQNEEPSFPHHIGSCSLLRKPVACKARVFRVPGVSRRTLLVTLWSILGST